MLAWRLRTLSPIRRKMNEWINGLLNQAVCACQTGRWGVRETFYLHKHNTKTFHQRLPPYTHTHVPMHALTQTQTHACMHPYSCTHTQIKHTQIYIRRRFGEWQNFGSHKVSVDVKQHWRRSLWEYSDLRSHVKEGWTWAFIPVSSTVLSNLLIPD